MVKQQQIVIHKNTNNYLLPFSNVLILANAMKKILAQQPTATAAMHGNKCISYQQLYDVANAIACQLQGAGISRGQRLAIDLPRSLELYQLIMGCLIAGISFMALPRGFDNTKQLKEAERANCVGILSGSFSLHEGVVIKGIGKFIQLTTSPQLSNYINALSDEIYCVRSSGTTGEPKIIPINSGQLSAFLDNSRKALKVNQNNKFLWLHDLSFDFSIWEIFGCLSHYGCVVIADENTKRDSKAVRQLLAEAEVNTLAATPSELRYIFFNNNEAVNFDTFSLTEIIIGGEKFPVRAFLPFFTSLQKSNVRLLHVYGPTETTVFCSSHLVSKTDFEREAIPIGKPFPGIKFSLVALNDAGHGELQIQGAQVFKGYHGYPLLTDAYATGDICWVNDCGQFFFVGRLNGYQKVNGFRVEPYEIEEHLQTLPNVEEAIVLVETNESGNFLFAYVRVRHNTFLSTRELRFACSTLPPYLRPSRYILLNNNQWPINDRGKTDRVTLRRLSYEQ